jgi:hypothetical protein
MMQAIEANWDARTPIHVSYQWSHGLGDLVTALVDAGLPITVLREIAEAPWPRWPRMGADRAPWYRLPEGEPRIPLMFALGAVASG